MARKKMTAEEREKYRARVLAILTRHIGEEKAIDMGALYCRVFEQDWRHKINDTRKLRSIITELRHEGCLIGEVRRRNRGGYYLARSASELNAFFDRRIHEALKKLRMISNMKKIGLPEMLGQMTLNLKVQGSEVQSSGVKS